MKLFKLISKPILHTYKAKLFYLYFIIFFRWKYNYLFIKLNKKKLSFFFLSESFTYDN